MPSLSSRWRRSAWADAAFTQGIIFGLVAVRAPRIAITLDLQGLVGLALAVYALVAYPVLAYAFGQRYPAMPTFGLPCPTTIFTCAVLLWTRPSPRPWAYAVPVLWAAVGTSAAVQLAVREDFALPVAAVSAVWLLAGRRASASD